MRNLRLPDVGATIDILGGLCPVQADGTIGKKRFYFRSRWNQWHIYVGDDPVCKPQFTYGESWGDTPGDAGYMPQETAILMIIRGLENYRTWEGSNE